MATESTKSNREHSFDFELASIVGVEKAILLKNINYWCKENKRKGLPNCLIDGHWFTQESLSSLADKYPYMRRSNIARWMQELFELEWIKVVASKGAKSFYGCGEVFELWDSNGDYKTKLSQNETAIKAKKDAAKLSQNETISVPKQDSLSPKMGQTPILDIESNFEGNVEGEENAQNALTPPFTPVGTIESDEHVEIMLHLLEAEKKEKDFTGAGPTPPTELLVTTHTPQAPYLRVVELVEVPVAPGPKSPGDKIRELCAVNYKIREGFTMSRKIPGGKFDEYLSAFDAEQAAMPIPKKYLNDNDLVSHFLNFSGVRWGVEQRIGQPQRQGRGAQLQNSGSDMSKYDQPQKF